MSTSSILGGSQPPEEISGKDVHALGTSDNSDSGSDVIGAYGEDELASDTDSAGTGERAEVGMGDIQLDVDILPDQIEQALGAQEDVDTDETVSAESSDLSEVDDIADDSEDLDVHEGDEDEEPSGKREKR